LKVSIGVIFMRQDTANGTNVRLDVGKRELANGLTRRVRRCSPGAQLFVAGARDRDGTAFSSRADDADAHCILILAFQRAPASALTPFTYMQLIWATLAGSLVFGEFPDRWSMFGMAVNAGSGLAIALCERRSARSVTALAVD